MVAPSDPPEGVGKNVYDESTVNFVQSTFPFKVMDLLLMYVKTLPFFACSHHVPEQCQASRTNIGATNPPPPAITHINDSFWDMK